MIKLDQTAIDQMCENKHVMLDMSDIDKALLSSKEDVILLLRNLDINPQLVDLDFSKCSYDDKEEWLKCYATVNEKVELKELVEAWTQIVHSMLSHCMSDVKCSLLDEIQLKAFVKNNIDLCTKVVQLIHDSMEWMALVAAKKSDKYIGVEKASLSPNMLFCCKHISEFDFSVHSAFKTCKEWPTLFTADNIEPLQQMMKMSKCCMLLYGQHTPEWDKFMKLAFSAISQKN